MLAADIAHCTTQVSHVCYRNKTFMSCIIVGLENSVQQIHQKSKAYEWNETQHHCISSHLCKMPLGNHRSVVVLSASISKYSIAVGYLLIISWPTFKLLSFGWAAVVVDVVGYTTPDSSAVFTEPQRCENVPTALSELRPIIFCCKIWGKELIIPN